MYSYIQHMRMCAKVVFPLSVIGFIKYIKVNSSNQIENFARVNSLNHFFELSFVILKKKIEIKGDFIFLMNDDAIFFLRF